jgi:hypothetical protein
MTLPTKEWLDRLEKAMGVHYSEKDTLIAAARRAVELEAENERLRKMIGECVEPEAAWHNCCICGKAVKACEGEQPCPVHPDGCELTDGRWVCSGACWDVAVEEMEEPQP